MLTFKLEKCLCYNCVVCHLTQSLACACRIKGILTFYGDMKRVLYLTRNGCLEPLGQSQILPYLIGLSNDFAITLITFEKPADRSDLFRLQEIRLEFSKRGIIWIPLHFRFNPRPWAPLLGLVQLGFIALFQFCNGNRPELVHARSYLPALLALTFRQLTGVPFIFDMRALWPEELITAGHLRRGSLMHRLLLLTERLCLQKSIAVVSLTRAAISYLTKQYPAELAGKPIAVIPTCADLVRFQPHHDDYGKTLVISCIGTLLSGWFLIDWLRAFFDAITRADPNSRFEVISRDPYDAILAALRPSPAWAERLVILSASPGQMPDLIQRHSASAMFFTSGLSKLGSSPTRMAEVLGCGRPVVVNQSVGDVEHVVEAHRVGVLARGSSVEQMDYCVSSLFDLLQDPELSTRCRRTSETFFSLESGTESYRRLYSQILS